jgi:xanthine dehydrogenase iron-sulfur cluster and FAD-binding subunit A
VKPPPFDYHAPTTIAEAVSLLSRLDNPRLLAGGQSLMPMLNMRFAFPDHVIDLNRVAGLSGITLVGETLRIGAMTRQRDLQDDPVVQRRLPLLAEALTHVGHTQTRNRGTIGGSLCHLDPAAELVAVAVALDAMIEIVGPEGSRTIPAAEFPLGYMTPCLAPDELVAAVHIPLPPEHHGACFTEFSRRHGDFAIVSAAVLLTLDTAGRIDRASVTLGGVAAAPLRMPAVEAALCGSQPGAALFAKVAVGGDIDAMSDAQIPAWYRRRLATVLMRRALETAHARFVAGPSSSPAMTRPPTPHRAPDASSAEPYGTAWVAGSSPATTTGAGRLVQLRVNGHSHTATVPVRKTLADFLREDLKLTGTHLGCEHGVCGACTVLLDGRAVRSCLMLATQADGHEIRTVEGLAPSPTELHPLQRAFCDHHGLQCGFCTPGLLTTLTAFLQDCPNPTAEEVRIAVSGNICRCTGYQAIVDATLHAAAIMRDQAAP